MGQPLTAPLPQMMLRGTTRDARKRRHSVRERLPSRSSSLMHTSTASRPTRPLTGHNFFLLFLFLLAILVCYPYVQNGGFGYFAFRIVGSAGILIAVYAIRLRRTLLLVALLLAVPALLERTLLREPDAGLLSILSILLSFQPLKNSLPVV